VRERTSARENQCEREQVREVVTGESVFCMIRVILVLYGICSV
jgi:hypothetical protein